jgi:multidrug resistance efflux pump
VWNPFKTLSERDSARLRRHEAQINDLTADIEQCLRAVERLNARLRQRASRASRPDDDANLDGDGDVPYFVRPSPVEQAQSSESVASLSADAPRSQLAKAQLRQLARQRGLLPQLPASRAG